MTETLQGRSALVTGAGRGIGKGVALELARAGCRVAVNYVTEPEKALETVDEIRQLGGKAIEVEADVSVAPAVSAMIDRVTRELGGLDILVNNAGAASLAEFDAFPENGWDKVVDLNLKSPFFLTQALAPALRAAGTKERPAKVINVASIDGIRPNPQETYSYQASKAGLIHLTRRMAARLIEENICVNAIAPGAFASEMNRTARDQAEEVAQRIPARRIGTDEDMQGVAIFLASRAGDYAVGITIAVDGGIAFGSAVL